MNLHEFQAKELLSRFGVPVPSGRITDNGSDAVRIAERLGFARFVVKAQVQVSDRLAHGGVRFSISPKGVGETVRYFLDTPFLRPGGHALGERVRWVLIEEAMAPMQLLYAAVFLDSAQGALTMMASSVGGAAIERRTKADPSLLKSCRLSIEGARAIGDFSGLAASLGFADEAARGAADIFEKMASLAVSLDATQVEVNPLAFTWDGRFVALDAKVHIDDNALFRHPAFAALSAATEVEEGDPLALGAERHHINYQRLEGDVGVVVNGAGLALATIDAIVDVGGRAANFMDVRTTATSLDVAYGLELIVANSAVRSILVNVHGGGMQRCDTIAEGLGVAIGKVGRHPPLVIRMAGNNADYAHTVLANNGVTYQAAENLAEAASLAVAAAKSRS
ncbi:MAG TPA: acetate--CoA ligase family protein [Hyphomicrobiaceae bacterium]|nr:acetate--CoA ligase family protein [Hyphomicrobiaceae bacterium]